ncbi:MAG: hypothetical protein ACTSU2_08815 [Promethearchaeota archaeon]
MNNKDNKIKAILSYVKKIWSGNSTKREYLMHFGAALFIYFLGILLAALKYPGGFSIDNVYMSYLGGSDHNPTGYIYYCTANFITGILLVPHFIFLYKRIAPTTKALTFISNLFGILGSIGFAMIGIFHQGILPKMHQLMTNIAFGGFGIAVLLTMFILIRKMCLRDNWPSIWSFLLLYGTMFGILIMTLLFDFYPDFFIGLGMDPRFLGNRFLEWFYFFTVLEWFIVIVLIIPDKARLKETK